MNRIVRTRLTILAALAGGAVLLSACGPRSALDDPEYAAACVKEPLTGVGEREAALRNGYTIDARFNCIEKASYEALERTRAQTRQVVAAEQASNAAAGPAKQTLADARAGVVTAVRSAAAARESLPDPPDEFFVRSDYQSNLGQPLAAFVTPDPGDSRRHPAIVWIAGGDSNSLGNFWTPGMSENDQSASAFRRNGIVMMFPSLRGAHMNPGRKEYFFGEVDDVIAAARHLATLPYVDPAAIYLGGHSTGGTLALLVAEAGANLAGVFAFGPAGKADGYGELVPVDFATLEARELTLRSPKHWLAGITSPTWIIEGERAPSNIGEFAALCGSGNPAVTCIRVPGHDHFSVLDLVNRRIASRLVVSADGFAFKLRQEDFAGAAAR
jgi:acetyl esterase/lipase